MYALRELLFFADKPERALVMMPCVCRNFMFKVELTIVLFSLCLLVVCQAASTAHLLLQLLTTGLKADHTKLLRDLLLELLYTVNKMLKKVEHMPDHGLFVRAEVRAENPTPITRRV